MIRSFSLPVLVMLVLSSILLDTSDGFQVVAPMSRVALPAHQFLSSNLFVGKPTAASAMSSAKSSITTNNENDKMALTMRMRKFVLALWRFLMLPMRLLRTTPTDSSQGPEAASGSGTTVLESSSVLVEDTPTVEEPSVAEEQTTMLESTTEPVIVAVPKKVVNKNKAITTALPKKRDAPRWATATSDLSGEWILMASDDFKQEYDEYLKQLGQPLIVRGMALGIIGLTREVFEQKEEGRTLIIRGVNARGGWERSLVASGVDGTTDTFEPNVMTVVTADDESVQAEAWWEDRGASHISWMRGVSKYGGGDFESKRYLEQNGKVLVCESVFHPEDETREKAKVTWKFLRKSATL